MKITNNQQYNTGFVSKPKTYNSYAKQVNQQDCFVNSSAKNNSSISFGRGFFSNLMEKLAYKPAVERVAPYDNGIEPTSYHDALAKGINEYFDIVIPSRNLTNILTPEETKNIISNATADNYIAKQKNIDAGTYFIDLDYESNHTKGGKENLFDIMEKMVKFADELYEKTGKDFVFALADRDTMESLRHVVRLIGENPEKYKHLKFIPAVKISFAHEAPNSPLQYENSSFIAYGINPFSENLISFMENTTKKRKLMILNFLKSVNELYPEFGYNLTEFMEQNKLSFTKDYCVSNLYWRAREYAQNTAITAMQSKKQSPEEIMKNTHNFMYTLGEIIFDNGSELLDAGRDSTLLTDEELNSTIKRIFEKYSTHTDASGKLVSSAENLFDDLIYCLDSEEYKPIIAYAAPFDLCFDFDRIENITFDQYPKTVEYMKRAREKSKGMITAFQSVVPAYSARKNLNIETIKRFNQYIRDNSDGFYEVGGSYNQYIEQEKPPVEEGESIL